MIEIDVVKFSQKTTFCNHYRMRANRFITSASEFAKRYNLGEPQFGNFFQAQYDKSVDLLHARFID